MEGHTKHNASLKTMNSEDKSGRTYQVGNTMTAPGAKPTIHPETIKFGQKLAKSSNGMLGK